jgi:uncharacterized iron-regulated membrane protein
MDDRVEIKQRKRQLLPPEFVRAMLAGHSALGLAFAALIYVVCLTGTVCVFIQEFHRWEQPDAPLITRALTPDEVDAGVRAAYAQAKVDNAAHDIFIMGPRPSFSRFYVNYHDHETGAEGSWFADANGRLTAREKAPWSEFIGALHMQLHLPRTWGRFVVGLVGVALLSSLISGLLSHPRIFKDAFSLRWGGSRRLQEADLHNRLGVWGLPFHVVVSLSGALLGLSTLIVGVLAMAAYNGNSEEAFAAILGPRATADETAAPIPDVAAMIRQVQAAKPGATFTSVHIDHIGKAGQVVHLGMRTPGHVATGNTYYFRGDGTPIGDGGLETGTVGQQILGVLQPLHFGWFGGFPVKIAYGVLGLALAVITHTGVTIWLARRRDKGRPAPRWEKVWAVVGWSQPLAFAASAATALINDGEMILYAYLASIAGAFALAAMLPSAASTVFWLRLLSAISLVALVTAHLTLWSARIADPMPLIVDGATVAIALAIAAPIFRRVGARANQPATA